MSNDETRAAEIRRAQSAMASVPAPGGMAGDGERKMSDVAADALETILGERCLLPRQVAARALYDMAGLSDDPGQWRSSVRDRSAPQQPPAVVPVETPPGFSEAFGAVEPVAPHAPSVKLCKYLHSPGKRCRKCGHVESDPTERAMVDPTVYGDHAEKFPRGYDQDSPSPEFYSSTATPPTVQPGAPAETPAIEKATTWHNVALVHGYNELAKTSKTLGEKVYFRLARDQAEEWAAQAGVKINRGDQGNVVLELTAKPPFIVFHERDIELMREAVAAFDERAIITADRRGAE